MPSVRMHRERPARKPARIDVLLTTLFYTEERRRANISRRSNVLGLAYLKSCLNATGLSCKIVDPHGKALDLRETVSLIGRFAPRVIGISASTGDSRSLQRLTPALKELFPEVSIVVGGWVGFEHEEVLESVPSVDYVVVGEGEVAFPLLVQRLLTGDELAGLAGLAERVAGKVRFYGHAPTVEDVDALPVPDLSDVPPPSCEDSEGRTLFLYTSRGCPHRCSFCEVSFMHERVRTMSHRKVAEDIRTLVARYPGVKEVVLNDDFFDLRRLPGLVEAFETRELGYMKLVFQTRARNLNRHWSVLARPEIRRMVESVGLGLESMNDEQLEEYSKGSTAEENWEAVVHLRELGIPFRVYILVDRTVERFSLSLPYYWRREIWRSHQYFGLLECRPQTDLYEKLGPLAPQPWQLAFMVLSFIYHTRHVTLVDLVDRFETLLRTTQLGPAGASWQRQVRRAQNGCETTVIKLIRDHLLASLDIARAVEVGHIQYDTPRFRAIVHQQELGFQARLHALAQQAAAQIATLRRIAPQGWRVLGLR